MKKTLLAVITLLTAFTACKNAANDPKETAKAFYEALAKKDFDEAAKYATQKSKSALDMMKSAIKMAEQFGKKEDLDFTKDMKGKKIDFGEPQMDGTDRAKIFIMADGKEQMPLILVKEDGAWKVAFDKATIMNTERNTTDTPKQGLDVADSVINHLDDVQDTLNKVLDKAQKSLDSVKKEMQ